MQTAAAVRATHPVSRAGSVPVTAVPAAGAFVSVAPSRVLDTRTGFGAPKTPVAAGGSIAVQIDGRGGIPASGVSAVVVNVTVTGPTAAGYITAYPDGTGKPTASNLNFIARQTIPNLVVVPVGGDGKIRLYNGSAGTVQLLADIAGYYHGGTPTVGGAFVSVAPSRVLDTRTGFGAPKTPVAAGGSIAVQIDGRGGIPASGVSAVVVNVTVTGPTAAGYITAYPDGTGKPTASNLNFVARQTIPNLVVVPVGGDGKIRLYNGSAGTVQLLADIAGYYHGAATAPPVVSALSTNSGPAAGSTRVVLTGSNFAHLSAVAFGGVAGTGLTVASSSSLFVTAPPHAAGQVDVMVTTSDGSSAVVTADKFTFVAGQYTIQVGISQATVANAGGWANALAGAQTMVAAINNTYNDPANHLTMQYNFIASSITEYTDATSAEYAVAHPNSNFKLLLADDSDVQGGWYGSSETVVDYWHYMTEHAFSQDSIDGTVHEFGHARGGIDEYALDVASAGNAIDSTSFLAPRPSIMSYPYGVHTLDTYTQGLINREGDTLEHARTEAVAAQAIPVTISVNVLRAGVALSGAKVTLYPVVWFSGTVTTTPSFTASTGTNGVVALPPNVFGQAPEIQGPWNVPTPMFLVTVDYAGAHASTWLTIIDAGLYSFGHPGSPYALTLSD